MLGSTKFLKKIGQFEKLSNTVKFIHPQEIVEYSRVDVNKVLQVKNASFGVFASHKWKIV